MSEEEPNRVFWCIALVLIVANFCCDLAFILWRFGAFD